MSGPASVGIGRIPEIVTLVTPGFRGSRGGLESHTSALTKELARQGIRVVVLTAQRGIDHTKVERHDDCWVVTYPAWAISSMSVSPQLLWAAIRSRRKDRVMHVHSYHATTAMVLLGRRAPTVFTPHYHGKHGHSRLANLLHVPYYHLIKRLVSRCDAIICVSDAERQTLITDFPLVADRVTVIPNGIDASTIRKAHPMAGEPPTVLCVGRLEPYKRFDDVIRAFRRVPSPTQLVIAGDGAQRDELTALASRLGLQDRVKLVGKVTDGELHRWLRTAHVFVSMSEREAFGMAPLEAACAGARIILSNIPAHREIADEFLRPCVTVMTDESTAALGAEIRRQLIAPRSDKCSAPDWHDVVTRTVDVYMSSGAVPATPTEVNGRQFGRESLQHEGFGNMSKSRTIGRGRRTSYLDRTWLNHWTVLSLAPIHSPDVDELRTKMVQFMESDPRHPLCCTLEDQGKRWRPVAPEDRQRHVMDTIVPGGAFDLDDPYPYLDVHRPDSASTAPFKVMVGPDSITLYFAHACGDAAVFSPFSVLMALGDVDGLRPLKADAGLGVALRIFLKEAGPHWSEWWNHLRSRDAMESEAPNGTVAPQRSRRTATTATGTLLAATEFEGFKAWRKNTFPEIATNALMASAAYLALAAEGIPVADNGFYTLVDLRRHLPKKQSLRPGNFAKSAFIPADMTDPAAVGAGLRQLVSSSRAVPALLSGALSVALRRPTSSAPQEGEGPMTMTFNSMMRNPGVEHIPWIDPSQARYNTMAYPVDSKGISVSACAIEGLLLFSASFDPHRVDARVVTRALERLHDMPSLLVSRILDGTDQDLEGEAFEVLIAQPTVDNAAR
jgi:glycosyltransferase involved in cell wall biosynthesis